MESDKKSNLVSTCDVCFHSLCLSRSRERGPTNNHKFRELIIQTAIEGVNKMLIGQQNSSSSSSTKYEVKMEEEDQEKKKSNYHILKGISYKVF